MTPTSLQMELARREAKRSLAWPSDIFEMGVNNDEEEGRENIVIQTCNANLSTPINRVDALNFSKQPLSPRNLCPSPIQRAIAVQKKSALDYDGELQRSIKRQKQSHPNEELQRSIKRQTQSHPNLTSDERLGFAPRGLAPVLTNQNHRQPPSLSPADIKLMNAFYPNSTGYTRSSIQLAGVPQERLLMEAHVAGINGQLKLSIPSQDSIFADAPESSPLPSPSPSAKKHSKVAWDPEAKSESYIDNDEIACLNLGQEFRPPFYFSQGQQKARLCDCGMALCREIGYPNLGSFEFPSGDQNMLNAWCRDLRITDPQRVQQIRENPAQFRIAYWHFRPEHRTFHDRNGMWVLRWGSIGTARTVLRAVPDAYLQEFIDNLREEQQQSINAVNPCIAASVDRPPSQRMMKLHKHWVQVRRPPVLEP